MKELRSLDDLTEELKKAEEQLVRSCINFMSCDSDTPILLGNKQITALVNKISDLRYSQYVKVTVQNERESK